MFFSFPLIYCTLWKCAAKLIPYSILFILSMTISNYFSQIFLNFHICLLAITCFHQLLKCYFILWVFCNYQSKTPQPNWYCYAQMLRKMCLSWWNLTLFVALKSMANWANRKASYITYSLYIVDCSVMALLGLQNSTFM